MQVFCKSGRQSLVRKKVHPKFGSSEFPRFTTQLRRYVSQDERSFLLQQDLFIATAALLKACCRGKMGQCKVLYSDVVLVRATIL